ncbi:MAG: ATP-binding protein [Dongiaceae bacterium]
MNEQSQFNNLHDIKPASALNDPGVITFIVGFVSLAMETVWSYISPETGLINTTLSLIAAFSLLFTLYWLMRQVLTNRALRLQADVFNAAFDRAADPIFILDKNLRTVAMNAAGQLFLRNRNEPLLATLDRLVLPEDKMAQGNLALLRTAATESRNAEADIRVYSPTNFNAHLLILVSPMPFGLSTWRIVQGALRSGSYKDMAPGMAELYYILDQIPVGLFALGDQGLIIGANDTLARWLGYTPGELIEAKVQLDDIMLGQGEGQEAGVTSDKARSITSYPITMKDRQGNSFSATLVRIPLNEGQAKDDNNPTRSGGLILRQMDSHISLEEAFRRARLLFKRWFEDVPVGIVLVDLDGRITEANRVFRKMMQKNLGNVEGRLISEAIVPEDREKLAAIFTQSVMGAQTLPSLETKILTDTEKVASLYIGRMETEYGTVFGFVVHMVDVTEQKNLEVQFVQSQKMQAVGQLAGGVAHDFNNLLTAMIGFCDLLLLRHRPGDQSFADIMQIKQNATRAANLVRQLLAFSRQQQLKPRVVNVTELLSELSNLLRRLIGENIKFDISHERDLWLIKVDPNQFEQIIINMVVNARDAMPQGGTLRIKTSNLALTTAARMGGEVIAPGSYVRIDITDTGIGISKENLTRIFEPFFTTKSPGSGTGLGLSTVYGIVKQTGGYVTVHSAINQGTSFSVLLPRHDGPIEADEDDDKADQTPADLTGVGTILLVEDEDPVRAFSSRALRNKGYQVLEANSGEAALQLLTEQKPKIDMLITDVMMPGMDGPALIREVRKTMPDIRVICISGYAEDALRSRIGADENIHFLGKPFTLKAFAGKVKEVMEKKG